MSNLTSQRNVRHRRFRRTAALLSAVVVFVAAPAVAALDDPDPREGLAEGQLDAATAAENMTLLSTSPKPEGFFSPTNFGSLSFANSDIAFQGNHAWVGNFMGFQLYDISGDSPVLLNAYLCPGGQGDLSVYGNLLFMSVEETRGKIDCTLTPAATATTRFRGVRIFDISDPLNPVQLPGVQTCAGSHTHSLLVDPDDTENVYIYNSGTAGIRSAAELAGCNGNSSLVDPTTTNFAIQVIKVPLAAPETAHVVSNPRIFSICGSSACIDDYASGALNGLPGSGVQPTYPPDSPRSPGGQSRSQASRCHDITLYPEIGLGAGACQGWGLLLDISDPVNPVRIHAVEDYNFAYWHSATFNNDGTKVIFTDEWGGGTGARCRATDPVNWGANAYFDIVDTPTGKQMEWRSYYKLPAVQTSQENCVAHNGSLVPIPGRDIMVQAWYQGGTSVIDFTDSSNPVEIAFFDRGPVSAASLVAAGHWSSYWYNGTIYGSEIGRGFDSFALEPSEHLSAKELSVAASVTFDAINVQGQSRYDFAPSFDLVDVYVERAVASGALSGNTLKQVTKDLEQARHLSDTGAAPRAIVAQLDNATRRVGGAAPDLTQALADLTATLA
jgi:hypothetical protein